MENRGLALNIKLEDEMRQSYLDYAMSVIIGRALPDVRDGLKPVHRRILYAMHKLGLEHNKPFKKSARVVGDVIGQYHPHGDQAVYDALVRMAQTFSMRYPLVDGQGNFGSVDGDPAAAMRYTEVRMDRLAHEFLEDLERETVDFVPNYDNTLTEPTVLPTLVPNLLLNGSSGIAVGMATNIPPHNMGELVDGLLHLSENPEAEVYDLMAHIPGPDFPTAGIIRGVGGIRDAYRTGRGAIKIRARAHIEEAKKGRERIVVTELPYQVNKARLIEKVVGLVKEKKLLGIDDLRDESDRTGMRVVFRVKRGENSQVVLNNLFSRTQMEVTFGVILLAVVDNRPEVLSLKKALTHFLDYRREVVRRRTEYELNRAQERAHVLEGLKIALDNLDEVVALIRSSPSPAEAKVGLMERFAFTERQAKAVLEMRLQRLTSLERDKILKEFEATLKDIEWYSEILGDPEVLYSVVRDELKRLKEDYADPRRTEIEDVITEITDEDLIPDEEMVVTVTLAGYIKRTPLAEYRSQRRGGKGKVGMSPRTDDFVDELYVARNHDRMLMFTNTGRAYTLKVYQLPQTSPSARGKHMANLLSLKEGEKVAAVLPLTGRTEGFVVMASRKGLVKKTELDRFMNVRITGIIAMGVREEDELISARLTDGDANLLLASRGGKAIKFHESEVRPMGRSAQGVIGMDLDGSELLGLEVVQEADTILTVTELGLGKRTSTGEYPLYHRKGKGVITLRTSERTGPVAGFKQVADRDEIMLITERGKLIRMPVEGISVISRNTQGVKLIELEEGDRVTGLALIRERREEEV